MTSETRIILAGMDPVEADQPYPEQGAKCPEPAEAKPGAEDQQQLPACETTSEPVEEDVVPGEVPCSNGGSPLQAPGNPDEEQPHSEGEQQQQQPAEQQPEEQEREEEEPEDPQLPAVLPAVPDVVVELDVPKAFGEEPERITVNWAPPVLHLAQPSAGEYADVPPYNVLYDLQCALVRPATRLEACALVFWRYLGLVD